MNLTTNGNIVGTTIDSRFKVLSHTGDGKLSCVFKAEDQFRKYTVALKFLREGLINPKSLSKYRLLADNAKALAHPNIVKLFACESSEDGQVYLVSEHLEATDLAHVLAARKGLPVDVALSIMAQVCAALEHAHAKGIIHGDLTPNNIMMMVESDDTYMVKIADFGVMPPMAMRLNPKSEGGSVSATLGDPRYFSPEQCSNKSYDTRADIYAAGCLLYACLTGVPPFDGTSREQILEAQTKNPIPALKIDGPKKPALEAILKRCLAKSPKERYQRASELHSDLTVLAEGSTADWENKSNALKPVVPLKSKPVALNLSRFFVPAAAAVSVVGIAAAALVGLSLADVQIPVLMPYEVLVQEQFYDAKDPRLVKNLKTMIGHYKARRQYAEAGRYADLYKKATQLPIEDNAIYSLKFPIGKSQ